MQKQTEITNIVLGGVGGQGVLVASDILTSTALKFKLDVKKSEVHGMAQRGGSVFSHVRFGPKIYSPLIGREQAHFLLAFERLEGLRYLDYLQKGGKLLVNNQVITPMTVSTSKAEYPQDIEAEVTRQGRQLIIIEGISIAQELGNMRLLNVIMLGALANYLSFPEKLWLESIKERLPAKFYELNQEAFARGKAAV
ncbi:MAG: indolepyruvate oxidoreductase subunit beta [Methanosarcinaceae archaeon]